MQFTGDYPSNPPAMLKDLFKINLLKTMAARIDQVLGALTAENLAAAQVSA